MGAALCSHWCSGPLGHCPQGHTSSNTPCYRHAPPHRVGLVLVALGLLIALLVYIGALLSLQSSFCPESMQASLSLINSICMPEKKRCGVHLYFYVNTHYCFVPYCFSFCVCACQVVFMIESVLYISYRRF